MLLQFLTWLFFVSFEWGGMKNFSSLHILAMCTDQGTRSDALLKCKGKISISYAMAKVCDELYLLRKHFIYTGFWVLLYFMPVLKNDWLIWHYVKKLCLRCSSAMLQEQYLNLMECMASGRAAVPIFNRRKLKNRHELLVGIKQAWGRERPQSKNKLKKIEGWVW